MIMITCITLKVFLYIEKEMDQLVHLVYETSYQITKHSLSFTIFYQSLVEQHQQLSRYTWSSFFLNKLWDHPLIGLIYGDHNKQ